VAELPKVTGMEIPKKKTLADFPKFTVTAVRRGTTSAAGYITFELDGNFDRHIEKVDPHWFWLVFGEGDYLCAAPQSLDEETKAATLIIEAKEEPEIVGQALAYLSPYWQGYHVWMVLDPNWGWERKQFVGMDAMAEDFESNDTSIIGGREVKVWTKLSRADVKRDQSRHYPATDQTATPDSKIRVIPSGWDHEHCELCNSHIDIGMFGYCDPDDRWMCEGCYSRYVLHRDLAFVDEL
jgi:hypothetical protein